MTHTQRTGETVHHLKSDTVGVFAGVIRLDRAVVQLGIAGFDRAVTSVLRLKATRAGEEPSRPRERMSGGRRGSLAPKPETTQISAKCQGPAGDEVSG